MSVGRVEKHRHGSTGDAVAVMARHNTPVSLNEYLDATITTCDSRPCRRRFSELPHTLANERNNLHDVFVPMSG